MAITVGNYWLSQKAFPIPLAIGRVARIIALAVGFYLVARSLPSASLAFVLVAKTTLLLIFPVALWNARVFSAAEMETLTATKDMLIGMVWSKGRRKVVNA
jgi:hypothetical protein